MRNFKVQLSVAVLSMFFLLSCTSMPSVCDKIEDGESKLCDLAAAYNVNLSIVGKGIQVANALAIARGYYTKDQALEVATTMRGLHNGPLTYALWNTNLKMHAEKYPEIFKDIDLSVLDSLMIDTLLTPTDQKIMIDFWDRVIKSLEIPVVET